jgi:glycosyltransferase involved in cell wall biosynthesis
MQITVFHPGTQHSWQTALALQQLGKLERLQTSIFYQPDKWPYRLERWLPAPLASRAAREFRRFSHPTLDPDLVHTVGLSEWAERIAARAGLRGLAQRIDRFGNRQFVRHMAGAILSERPFALWGFNGSSLSSFELAKQQGRTCILDRTNGDFRIYNAMMDDIAERYGDWFLPIERKVSEADIATDEREYRLADAILVGSPFAAETIRQAVRDPAVEAKLRVLNYCYDKALFGDMPPPVPAPKSDPVRFLFMGLAIPRKGIHHVLEAIARIPRSEAELTIVGDLKIPPRMFAPFADRVTWIPPVARADVPGIMARHDVLVLPSYFEGAGIVLYEALAAGCALIQSDRCARAVTPECGIMLDHVDTEAVEAAMRASIADRDRLAAWRAAAPTEAQNYTFARYRANIAVLLTDMGI